MSAWTTKDIVSGNPGWYWIKVRRFGATTLSIFQEITEDGVCSDCLGIDVTDEPDLMNGVHYYQRVEMPK